MLKRFLAVLKARNIEFYRDTSAMVWNFVFPVVVVFGFAFATSGKGQDQYKVAVHRGAAQTAPASAPDFLKTQYVQFVDVPELDPAIDKLRRQAYDMVVDLGPTNRYWINSTSPKGYLAERILRGSADPATSHFEKQTVEGRETRYVDWLISGLLAMNMSFSALFGVGYTIVRYRKNGVLKRLKATPISAFEFLSAQVASRLMLLIVVTSMVYFGCNAVIHFQMLGSYFDLFVLLAAGAMCLISLGLVFAARISNEELAGGLLNLITWPMMFLSGVWFSLEGASPWVRKAAQIFPLTHVIDGSRAIMTEGATLSQVSYNLVTLLVMSAVFLLVGSLTFKWE